MLKYYPTTIERGFTISGGNNKKLLNDKFYALRSPTYELTTVLHGKMSSEIFTFSTLVAAIENGRIIKNISVHKNWITKKQYIKIYLPDALDYVKLYEKDFKNITFEAKYTAVKLSISELMHKLSADDFSLYVRQMLAEENDRNVTKIVEEINFPIHKDDANCEKMLARLIAETLIKEQLIEVRTIEDRDHHTKTVLGEVEVTIKQH